MAEMIKVRPTGYARYEELLLERDALKKQADIAMDLYVHEFGELTVEVFRSKVECIRLKKAISFCQSAVNRGKKPSRVALEKYLQQQMADYEKQLQAMAAHSEACRELHTSAAYDVEKAKRLYRELAKRLHPDLNPLTRDEPVLLDLWNRVVIAYHMNAVKDLQELQVLVNQALTALGCDDTLPDIPDLEERLAELEREIRQIVTTDPYRYRELLEDEQAKEDRRKELQGQLEENQQYRQQLQQALDQLLGKSGVSPCTLN